MLQLMRKSLYLARARTPAQTKGPFELELSFYGKGGMVIIQALFGAGKISSDVYAFISLVASSVLTHKHLSYNSERTFAIKGIYQQSILRSLGLLARLEGSLGF